MVDTFFGYDEESMDSESSSVASFRMDRTPATPDEDVEMVRTLTGDLAVAQLESDADLPTFSGPGSVCRGGRAALPSADQGVPGPAASLRPAAGAERRPAGRRDGGKGTASLSPTSNFTHSNQPTAQQASLLGWQVLVVSIPKVIISTEPFEVD